MSIGNKGVSRRRWARVVGLGALALVVTAPLVARADGELEGQAGGLLGLLALAVLLVGLGLAFGCFGATVSHLFAHRASVTFRVLCRRPGWSLLAGTLVTLLAVGLLALLRPAPPLQVVVLLGFLGALLLFAVAAATRLAGRLVDRTLLEDELPDLRVLLQGGLVLVAINAVPIAGTMLFAGILLAAVGATLLGYFTKRGQAAVAAPPGEPPAPRAAEEHSGT